jgi:hypothetical protein
VSTLLSRRAAAGTGIAAVAAALGAAALLLPAPRPADAAPASDVCVVQKNSRRYPSIQSAVNDQTCASIRVLPGTYRENVVISAGRAVTITGVAGATRTVVDGGGSGRVFLIGDSALVNLSGLTITGGGSTPTYVLSLGAGIFSDFGSMVTLTDSVVTGNEANILGGGIFSRGDSFTLSNTRVTDNKAIIGGGGIAFFGDFTVTDGSVISGNSSKAGGGGGVFSQAGVLTVTGGSAITGNTAASGGGVAMEDDGQVLLQGGSTISGNTASLYGGGVYLGVSELIIGTGSTITGNAASSGGGVYDYRGSVGGDTSGVTGNTPDDIYTFVI